MTRRWLGLVIVAALAAVAVGGIYARPSKRVPAANERPQPCLATFKKVREGMTRAEVTATVGAIPEVISRARFEGWVGPREWCRGHDAILFLDFDQVGRLWRVEVQEGAQVDRVYLIGVAEGGAGLSLTDPAAANLFHLRTFCLKAALRNAAERERSVAR
jgi:hypothetical protein